MKGDVTRDTFNASRHFSRVLMQQGRVQLDADWNEQTAILLHYLRALAADLIGPFGGPDNVGFGIFNATSQKKTATTTPGELSLSASEIESLTGMHVLLDGGRVPDGNFLLGKGHYYVDGLLCENENHVLYTGQPDLPAAESFKGGQTLFYLAYLDVWERHITYLEDESFPVTREVALGGPDTATRAKIVWQVKVLAVKDDPDLKPKTQIWANFNNNWGAWVKRFEPENRGRLKARVKVPDVTDSNNPCLTRPDARYRGAENQLYRVEIHQGGKTGKATFKWSRENGSVVFPIVQIGEEMITLAHLGRDHRQGLKVGDWVELSNDEIVLSGTVPPLFQVDAIDPIDSTARVKIPKQGKPLPSAVTDEQPLILRRWDHKSDLKDDGAVLLIEAGKEWLTLEDGVQIQFQPDGEYRTGDYWLFPARTATGDIEWPRDKDGNPLSQPPHGIKHHYAPLAIVLINAAGKIDNIDDLRSVMKPLAEKP